MKVYDCFIFYNELDLLRVRLVEHSPFVDYFVIVEGDHTFSGRPKACNFDSTDSRFTEFKHKIIHVNARLQQAPCNAWDNERTQRNALLSAITPAATDLVLIGDTDEIVSRLYWPRVIELVTRTGKAALRMETMYYYINLLLPEINTWTRIYQYKQLAESGLGADAARWDSSVRPYPRVFGFPASFGWHFSYIGSEQFIRNKIESFSHQEYNCEHFKDLDKIRYAIRNRKDIYGRYRCLLSVPVTKMWPLDMTQNPFWNQFTCPADPFLKRFLVRTGRRAICILDGIKARSSALVANPPS